MTAEEAVRQIKALPAMKATTWRERVKAIVAQVEPTPAPAPEPPPAPGGWRGLYTPRRFESFEAGLRTEAFNISGGFRVNPPIEVTRTSERGASYEGGSWAVKIRTHGGDPGCSCPRFTWQDATSWPRGAELWFGGSFLLPDTSLRISRLLNVGHWETGGSRNWNLALQCLEDGRFQVEHQERGGGASYPLIPVTLPRGRWFDFDIHARLGLADGEGFTEAFIDGRSVGSSTRRNMTFDSPAHFYNGGFAYFYPGNGDVTMYFDAPRIS
jgi:hypothetical protein